MASGRGGGTAVAAILSRCACRRGVGCVCFGGVSAVCVSCGNGALVE